MHPSLHASYAGATILPEAITARGRIGAPVWNLRALLHDLEIRLGLPHGEMHPTIRIQRWSSRLSRLLGRSPFYARSYVVDPVGTARTLLGWRDALVDAGWDGETIAGGERLETIAALEATEDAPIPPGDADRLVVVERALAAQRSHLYDSLTLFDDTACLPGRWRRVLTLLAERGTILHKGAVERGNAPGNTDLGRVQAALRGEAVEASALRGDGTFLVVRADSTWALAEVVAAMLRSHSQHSCVVIRADDVAPLDVAFATQGLVRQGVESSTRWRPALQILPLAMELAFEPRDPHRVLELLTLPVGPFAGFVGRELASAVSSSPGIAGPAWRSAKKTIETRVTAHARADALAKGATAADADVAGAAAAAGRLETIATWFEGQGFDAINGATPKDLADVAKRVSAWLRSRLARSDVDASLGTAYAQAQALVEAFALDPRRTLDLVAVRQIVETVGVGEHAFTVTEEQAGRIDHVHGSSGIHGARDVVVYWHATDPGGFDALRTPWRQTELRVLRAKGIEFADSNALLAARSRAARDALLSARARVILALPSGVDAEAHPILDEIIARLRAKDSDAACFAVTVDDLLAGRVTAQGLAVQPLVPLQLPQARATWKPTSDIAPPMDLSPTGLETLLGCPFRWVLQRRAGVREGFLTAIASGPKLNGTLGHRLVEILHEHDAFAKDADTLATAAGEIFDGLLPKEGATLLRPGMAFERAQLRVQLVGAVSRFATVLRAAKLQIQSAEGEMTAQWGARRLHGRTDLLLRTADAGTAVVDMKWGESTYRGLLEHGQAVQLAAYGYANQVAGGFPPVAYFALSTGQLLTTHATAFPGARVIRGRGTHETWEATERTLVAVEKLVARREIAVTGVPTSVSLLERTGVPEGERDRYLVYEESEPCRYCNFEALCGRKWEVAS